MAIPSIAPAAWQPWRVAPTSGFEVDDPKGEVGLVQLDGSQFKVTRPFRFSHPDIEQMLIDHLVRTGWTPQQARAAVDEARTFNPTEDNPTDLASIPRYMRWFESSYGLHSLAAIIHDELIRDDANDGALKSDALADRFFREMMRAAGVRWLKRWIMWAAVALRTRWAAKGYRRASVVLWIVLALAGIASLAAAAGTTWPGWEPPIATPLLWVIALVLPFVAAGLWGRQYGGGIIAAIAGLWILPAAVLAGVGYVIYGILERIFGRFGYN